MDRNREGRRGVNSSNNNNNNIMAAPPNGLTRRRHRSSSLRDSPDEDGTEVTEPGRLRDRGVVKKDRDRERDRDRSSRSKRRRDNRMVMSNRDDGDDTSDESVNDEDEEDDEDAGNGGGLRMAPPPPAATAVPSTSASHNSHPQQLHHRKSFPPVNNKMFRGAPAAPSPAWKAADEMIGVSVPRKARSVSTKRSHEWISGVASSTSPAPAPAPATAAPPSPSSSNVSVRKKMKSNGGGGSNSRQRPPKSLSKSSSSNAEELEIEIAEVLYGLMTQSQAPSKKEVISNDSSMKFDSNKSSCEAKSRVSSPVSNSTNAPQNSTSLSTAAPKRKRPRPVSETPVEIDHNQHHQSRQSPKTDNSSASASAAAENGGSSFGFTTLPGQKAASSPSSEPSTVKPTKEEERKCGVNVLTKEEGEKESKVVKLNDGNSKVETVIKTAASTTVTNLKVANLDAQSQKDEKFEIDLMAPPPQSRTSHGNDQDNDFSDHKQIANQETRKIKDDDNLRKSEKEESVKLTVDRKTGTIEGAGESLKQAVDEEINIQLNIDSEKSNKGSGSSNRSLHQALKHQQLSAKSESHSDKTAQSGSMPMPMSMANWPPMGYVAPLQGVISMDGNPMASAPIQPLMSHPRPKRCATHCYIARNIHYNQQFMKMNPFWPAASGSAPPMFGAKPCNLNVMPATELHTNIPQSMHDKGPPAGIFPGQTITKDIKSSQPATVTDPAQRKQQILLQQAMPPVASNNILHGPAFIFPFNQQQAVAASASVRPGSSKVTTTTAGGSGAASSATVSSSTTAAAPALSFNYPNISASDTQYLAILQNNPYPFPIPAVGAPPNYRTGPHAQAMPLFNGSFYSSQMIHPSQIPQPQAPPVAQPQTHQNSSGSTSSSQKHLQGQQRQQASGAAAVNSGGSLHNTYHAAHKSRSQQPAQQQNQHMNPSTGGEDSPSTADSRGSRAGNTMGVYNHNFPMPVRSKGLGQMDHSNGAMKVATANTAAGANSNDKKQHNQLQQQGLKRGGAESSLPPQTFAMSFAPMNGTTGMAQNHAIFQSLPESLKPSFHIMSAPTSSTAHHSQQKDFRITEEASRTTVTGHDASNADEDRKVSAGMAAKSGQSIAFSRPDLATDGSSGSNNRPSRSPISTSIATAAQSSHSLNAQFQQTQQQAIERARQHHQQQALQLQKGQQLSQAINAYAVGARSKNPPSSNGNAYPEHTISSSSMTAKFPNSISSFPLQTSNSSQVQSPQWRNSVRGPTTSQIPSSLTSATSSSAKNLHQSQQSSRSHQQSHTQISFGSTASQKLQPTTSVQMQQQQQQQQQNQNPGSNSGNRCSSPPMLVSSPTTSMSKGGGSGGGGGGSPRTNAAAASTSGRTGQASSLSSSQQAKNSPVPRRSSSPSILGNPNNSNSSKSQQQLQKQALQQQQQKVQAMMMYNHPYMQAQAQAQVQQHAASSMALYRMQQQQSASSSSSATLSLCPPVTHASAATSDPAKAIAAATSMMNHPQYGGAPPSMPAGFPQYVHNAPVAAAAAAAAVQVKPADQKQPAGE